MGKLIVFWSQYHGQCKTTASMAAVAHQLAAEGHSVCITHTQFRLADLEGMLNTREESGDTSKIYMGSGLNALILSFKGEALTKENVYRATLEEGDNLYLLPGIKRHDSDIGEEADILYRVLTKEVKSAFDYTLVDLASGMGSELTGKLLKAADVAVICVSQNKNIIAHYFARPLQARINDFDPEKVILCFGGYDRDIKVNYKNIGRKYTVNVGAVPYLAEYCNAISDGDVPGFFLNNNDVDNKEDGAFYFIQETKRLADLVGKVAKEEA